MDKCGTYDSLTNAIHAISGKGEGQGNCEDCSIIRKYVKTGVFFICKSRQVTLYGKRPLFDIYWAVKIPPSKKDLVLFQEPVN